MITIAKDIKDVEKAVGEIRAGGTDFQERRRSKVSRGAIIDITRLPQLDQIDANAAGSLSIGALATIEDIGTNELIQESYPGLALPAQTLATPQIRSMGTMGGVLCQRTRCWYYRHPDFSCYKKGGDSCAAREGNHHFGVCFDFGPCVFPHPSSIGLALITYDAEVEVSTGAKMSIKDFFGDGSDPSNDNTLKNGELLTHVHLPVPAKNERTAYFRLMSRTWAEWPLVEVIVRLMLDGENIRDAKVGIGGVGNIPFRLDNVEAVLIGKAATAATFEVAARLATDGANPLPQTHYKLRMVEKSVLQTLEMAHTNTNGGKLVV